MSSSSPVNVNMALVPTLINKVVRKSVSYCAGDGAQGLDTLGKYPTRAVSHKGDVYLIISVSCVSMFVGCMCVHNHGSQRTGSGAAAPQALAICVLRQGLSLGCEVCQLCYTG